MTVSPPILALVLAVQADAPAPVRTPDPMSDLTRSRLGTDHFETLRRQGSDWCAWSRLPGECQVSFVAASYSAIDAEICRQRILDRVQYRHGGVVAPYEEQDIRSTCGETIRLCRESWRHFYRVSASSERRAWTERQEKILSQNLRLHCGKEAPEDAQD